MDPIVLGKKIKEIYPQYANRDDAELGTKYLQKYGGAVSAVQSGRLKITDIPDTTRVGVSIGLNALKTPELPSADQEKQAEKLQSVRESASVLQKNLAETEAQGPILGRGAEFLNFLSGGAAAPQVADYEALRKSLIGPLARAISGEVGVLTDKDIARAEGLLPKITDADQLRKNKIKNLMDLLNAHSGGGQTPQKTQGRFTIEAVE